VKVAVEEPAATVTDAGTVSAALLLTTVTAKPPERAALPSVTVQVAESLADRDVGVQVSEARAGGATRLTAVLTEALL
jgi:hypothetical protein